MKPMFKKILFFTLSISLAACSAQAPEPTATLTAAPKATQTSIPTDTLVPAASETPDVLGTVIAQSTPVTEWKGIPIMPGALEGIGDDNRYYYTVNSSLEDIQAYYENELPKLGLRVGVLPGLAPGSIVIAIFGSQDDGPETIFVDPSAGGFIVTLTTAKGVAAIASRAPLQTSEPTEAPRNVYDPQGTPVAEWKGLPIMPQAIAGQEFSDEFSSEYSFKTTATFEEVQAFYNQEKLMSLNWVLSRPDQGQFPTTTSTGYRKGNNLLIITISIVEEGSVLVRFSII